MSYKTNQTLLSTRSNVLKEDSELRHLHPALRSQLARILDVGNGWKELAVHIVKPDNDDNEPLFTASDICILEEQKYKSSGSPTQALLEHWSTVGRKRPTIKNLLELLMKAQLYRAADFVAVDVLKGPPIERQAVVTLDNENGAKLFTQVLTEPVAGACLIDNTNSVFCDLFPHYAYSTLKLATNDFQENLLKNGGNKLGEGAFGGVYFGDLKHLKQQVAVKKLKDKMNKQFFTELEVLAKFQHDNLLPLIGYSVDGPMACLVYEYMENGSLEDKLSLKYNCTALNWKERLFIAVGAAKGICHLHSHLESPYIHRDIKSANILLDRKLNAKVGDFGLTRIGASNHLSGTIITSTVFGTSCYMAPEAIRGDISVKLDVFSYGIVLLELLTSLAPYDPQREEADILSHVHENCDDIGALIDNSTDPWDPALAKDLFDIAMRCTEDRKKDRPILTEVMPALERLLNTIN